MILCSVDTNDSLSVAMTAVGLAVLADGMGRLAGHCTASKAAIPSNSSKDEDDVVLDGAVLRRV